MLTFTVLLAGCRLLGGGGAEDAGGRDDAGAADAGCVSFGCEGGTRLATIDEPEWIRAIVLDGDWAYFATSADDPGGGTVDYFPGSVWRVPSDGSLPAELPRATIAVRSGSRSPTGSSTGGTRGIKPSRPSASTAPGGAARPRAPRAAPSR